MSGIYAPEALIAASYLRSEEAAVVSTNERKILQLIWRNPGMSRSEITGHTDLTQQSVHRILDQLAERGIILLGSAKPGLGRGQPSPTLRLNGDHAYVCGISVNTDVIGICLLDLSGRILGESSVALREHSMRQALDLVKREVDDLKRRNTLPDDRFFGVGFAIAGTHLGGTRHDASLPLHEWSLIELGPLISSIFERPAWVINGGKAGAIAESMFGVGRHIKHFAYLSFNYGFGGGLISDGDLLAGGNGNAGEFSQMYDDEEDPKRPALQMLIERINREGTHVPSIAYLRSHFDGNWPGVGEWVEEITPAYNRLVNAIWAVFDPQAIVFGGQVPRELAQMIINRTKLYLRPRYGVLRPSPKLIISDISSDASAIGAAILPFRRSFY